MERKLQRDSVIEDALFLTASSQRLKKIFKGVHGHRDQTFTNLYNFTSPKFKGGLKETKVTQTARRKDEFSWVRSDVEGSFEEYTLGIVENKEDF